MEAGLATKHPDIKTYRGRGLDDTSATIRADLTSLGFHASVRSANGAWYIDPYYHLDQSLYASYFGRDVPASARAPLIERDADGAELSVDKGYYHAADTVTATGDGYAAGATVTITISDPEGGFASRSLTARTDELGSFEATFVADPDGNLETHIVEASDGDAWATASYQVVRDDDPTSDPPTGDVLRTYRLALITDPGYSSYFGGPANVTPAKVTLVNRVTQLYEDDLSIRLVLIANNDLLNFNTWDATAPNGLCGAAACFAQGQLTGCQTARMRYVIGQVIGASNYDIGHLALGQPGGGVANLGVVGRGNKAGGCTGLATPVGDFFAVDYVAHEMGHQFSGNHTFNGNQLNCSGGNRSQATSVEPGSGSSIMAYAGICLTDDLAAHSDPYFSQRSLQEISTYTSSNQAAINEVQTVSLRHFGGGDEVQVVTFGPGYSAPSTIMPITLKINAAPSATSRGGAEEVGNTVTIATTAFHRLEPGDVVTVSGVPVAGYNGTFTVTAVPNTRSFQYTNPVSGLATSGGGTVTVAFPGATESGNTVTIRTIAPHGRSVGDVVTITGVGLATYNGTYTITAVPTPRTFEYTNATAGLAPSGGGAATYFSPFQVRIGGADSALIGGSGIPYNTANLQAAINAIPGFVGTVTVTGAAASRLHDDVRRPVGRHGRSPCRARRSIVRWMLRPRRRDEPRWGGRLVHPQLQRQRVRADHERHELLGGRDPRGAHADPARRCDRHGRRLRRWRIQQHRLPGHVHWLARDDERPDDARRPGLHAWSVRVRRRDRQGRRGRQQGRDHHPDRKHVADRHGPGRVHDPAANPVLADRQRDRRRERPDDVHLGAERPRRRRPARRSSTT